MISGVRVFLIWLPIFFGALLVLTVCLGRISANKNLEVAERWFPNYSVTRLDRNETLLRSDVTVNQAKVIQMNALEGLQRAPLSHRPFIHMAEVNTIVNEKSDNRDLFNETLRRNPRNRRALRALVHLNAVQNNYAEAVRQLDLLLNLKSEKALRDEYQSMMLFLSEVEEGRREIDKYLIKEPRWGKEYLSNLIKMMRVDNFDSVENSIKIFTANSKSKKNYDQLHKDYLETLKLMRKIRPAFDYWNSLPTHQEHELPYTVFNSNFKNRRELPPFNWLEVEDQKYFSEIDQEGGLYASYADGDVRVLAEQILMLEAGKIYRLDVDAEWVYRSRQGMFFWVLTCLSNNAVISGVNLDDAAKENSGGQHDFQVPVQECESQSIRLLAKSGQYAQRIWSRTNSLDITLLQ